MGIRMKFFSLHSWSRWILGATRLEASILESLGKVEPKPEWMSHRTDWWRSQ